MAIRVRGTAAPRIIIESLGTAFAWIAPALIVACELIGSTAAQSIGTTLLLLALLLGALWLPIQAESDRTPSRPALRRALGGVLLLIGFSVFGFGMLRIVEPTAVPPARLPEWLRTPTWTVLVPVLAAFPASLGVPWVLGKKLSGRDLERAGILIALVFLALLGAKTRVQGLIVLPYAKPWLKTLLPMLATVLALLFVAPRVPPVARFGIVVVCGAVLRMVGLMTWKLDPALRDMLPLVQSAQDALFSGANPYDIHAMQRGSEVPLTYLPGMWLLHGIPRLIGLDMRVTGIVADAVVAACLWWAASGVDARFRERARGLALVFVAAWLFSPSVHWNGIYAEPHAWWLVLAIVIAATLRRRFWLAAGALGVALATRHFAIVVAPFVVLAMVRSIGLRAALPRLALTGTLATLLLVPFVARDPEMFWFGTYRWLVEYGPVHQSWFWFKFGFSGPLYRANAAAWMPRAQAAIVLAMLGIALVRKNPRLLFASAGTAYIGFVMFNGIIWDSFYLGAALFPAFAAAGALPASPESETAQRALPKRLFATALALLGISALLGIYLLVTLARSQSRSGLADARAFISRQARAGDVIVDRSDFRLAFVHGKPLFDGAIPAGTMLRQDVFDPRFGPTGAASADRVWLVTRAARDEKLRRNLEVVASSTLADEQFGRYRVTEVQMSPRKVAAELAQITDKLAPSSGGQVAPRQCRFGGSARPMIFVHPPARAEAHLVFSDVPVAERMIVIAGIEDHAVVWPRADARVTAKIDDRVVGTLHVVNRTGAQWAAFDSSSFGAGPHRVELVVAIDDPARSLCVDALMLGASGPAQQ